jgi:hypothetical protein
MKASGEIAQGLLPRPTINIPSHRILAAMDNRDHNQIPRPTSRQTYLSTGHQWPRWTTHRHKYFIPTHQ